MTPRISTMHRPNLGERGPALAPKRRAVLEHDPRAERGIEPAADQDHDHVDRGRQNAGKYPGDQQLDDRDLGENPVDHERDARRNQRIERAAAGADAGGEALVVFVLQHFRDGEARHHGGGGDARSARPRRSRRRPSWWRPQARRASRRTMRRPRGTARCRCRNCRRSRPSAGTSGSPKDPSWRRRRTAYRAARSAPRRHCADTRTRQTRPSPSQRRSARADRSAPECRPRLVSET